MTKPVIQLPPNKRVTLAQARAELKWSPRFVPRWQGQYTDAQKFVDSEVLRQSEPFIPLLTGLLIASGIIGTDVGSGTVAWIAPYAKGQYYSPRRPGSQSGPLRGPHWFERMKAVRGQGIINTARKIAGGSKKA